jgi:deoxyribodipyrimidine photo-lyase
MSSSSARVSTCVVWFRRDLRLNDNPALLAACRHHARIIPLYIHAPDEDGDAAPGGAGRWWLHHALTALDASLRARSGYLVVRRGPARQTLLELCRDAGADAVYWNRVYDPDGVSGERLVASALGEAGIATESFNAALLHEPWEIATGKGEPYRVFTPFWKAARAAGGPAVPVAAPDVFSVAARPASLAVGELGLLPARNWGQGFAQDGRPGEQGALEALGRFMDEAVGAYPQQRDIPALKGTSRLSPHLCFGEIGPRQIWQACRTVSVHAGVDAFERQLYWREFAHHLLYHFPHTAREPLDPRFARFPWREAGADAEAWRHGRTGFPIVDAGMRELWQTGWMHNRVRMLAASLLTKHLLLPWQLGAAWFRDTLLDGDLACNSLGWQWTAGCGADAAPFFRVFNPVTQGERFDADGGYVRRWLPELAALPARYLHRPWEAPAPVLAAAGIRLGHDYPWPCVDLKEGRVRALVAWESIRQS